MITDEIKHRMMRAVAFAGEMLSKTDFEARFIHVVSNERPEYVNQRSRSKRALQGQGLSHGSRQQHIDLLNLFPITRHFVAIPFPSYSLKVVEKCVGFKKTTKVAGDWPMAIEATETEDQKQRDELTDQILAYNLEHLAASWSVFTSEGNDLGSASRRSN